LTDAGSTRTDAYPVLPGAEPFQSPGSGARARIGLALIHGFTGSPISMRPLAGLLSAQGFRVDLPRLPGHGTDERDMADTRYSDWVEAVHGSVERLSREADHVVLIGLSMGAAMSLDVAESGRHPKLAGVVTINVQILDRTGLAVKFAPLFENVVRFAPASLAGLRKDDIAKPGVSERAYARVPTAAGNSFTRELGRIRGGVSAIPCPVLVIYSREDHSVPPANSKALLALLPAERRTELVLERSYHVATLDYDLELIESNVAAFAERVARR
jgi:carboxylesterase